MTDKPDLIETVRDLEKFATSPTERQIAKEMGSLLFEHSTLKAENTKLKRDLHHYMMAANAEAELVDELQARSQADEALLTQAVNDLHMILGGYGKLLHENDRARLKATAEKIEDCLK